MKWLNKLISSIKPAEKPQSGLFVSPAFQPGKFLPSNTFTAFQALSKPEQRLSQANRRSAVADSRNLTMKLPEVDAIINILRNLVIGNGMKPIFKGEETEYGQNICKFFESSVAPSFGAQGIATDWNSFWKLIFRMVYRDGDVLLYPYTDRNGIPHCDVIEGPQIANRGGEKIVANGKYAGLRITDGVIYGRNGSPLAYKVLGDTADQDVIYSTKEAILVYEPVDPAIGRGWPVLTSAIEQGYNILDFRKLLNELVKMDVTVQLIVTNETGRPNPNAVAAAVDPFNTQVVHVPPKDGTTQPGFIAGTLAELTSPGTRYQKPGGKIEPLKSNRPQGEIQQFVVSTEKSFTIGGRFFHQFLLSPETIGGAPSRGITEILCRSVEEFQTFYDKYALLLFNIIIQKATLIPVAIGGVAPEYESDFTDWKFSHPAKLVLDASYQSQSNRDDIDSQIKSLSEVISETGRTYADVNKENVNDAVTFANGLAELLKQLQGKPQPVIDAAVEMYKKQFLPPPLPPNQNN